MSKHEFIDKLRAALTGRISAEQVQEHVNYYEDYINTRIRMGDREEDVLASLGEPRLIAKTIVETSGQSWTNDSEDANYQNIGHHNTGYQNSDYQNNRRVFRIPGWLWFIIVILIFIVISGVVFTVLSAFAPIIFIMIIVMLFMKLFDWLN